MTTAASRWLPGALYGPPLRWTTPTLAGRSDRRHIALTFDDGPDSCSTPQLLATLERHDVRATFFLIGEHIAAHRDLIRQMYDRGHELAIHGWTHSCVLKLSPQALEGDLRRASETLADVTGTPPRWYRPPYGVTTIAAKQVSAQAGLTPVLWTAWGRDWSRHVGAGGIVRRVNRTLKPGGTVLLHDTDRYASPDSWRRTITATDLLLTRWHDAGIPVGPLAEHWLTSGGCPAGAPERPAHRPAPSP